MHKASAGARAEKEKSIELAHCHTLHQVHHDYFCNYTDKQQLAVRTGGKQLVVNQDRNEKMHGYSHWESNPRPPTLAVDALTTELRLPCSSPAPFFSI